MPAGFRETRCRRRCRVCGSIRFRSASPDSMVATSTPGIPVGNAVKTAHQSPDLVDGGVDDDAAHDFHDVLHFQLDIEGSTDTAIGGSREMVWVPPCSRIRSTRWRARCQMGRPAGVDPVGYRLSIAEIGVHVLGFHQCQGLRFAKVVPFADNHAFDRCRGRAVRRAPRCRARYAKWRRTCRRR